MFSVLALLTFTDESMSEERLTQLIEQYGNTILRTAYLYLHDKQRAEDACQEVFIKLFKENRTFESANHEKAFILRVTINHCKDQLKSFWQRRIVLDDTKEPEPEADIANTVADNEARRALYHCVLALPEEFKSVVLLYYYEGMNTREIAEVLGVPDSTVRSRLKRARERLLHKLKGGVHHA